MVVRTATAEVREDLATGSLSVNQYRLLQEAGRGTFCAVRWAENAEGRRFAVKVFPQTVLDRHEVAVFDAAGASTESLRIRISREIGILSDLRHDGVMALEETIDDRNQECLYVIMEGLTGGQLMSWDDELHAYSAGATNEVVRRHWGDLVRYDEVDDVREDECSARVFREPLAKFVCRQLLAAVEYLHGRDIIHKDLKPDNIMLSMPVPSRDARFVKQLNIKGWPTLPSDPLPQPDPGFTAAEAAQLLDPLRFLAKIGDFNSAAVAQAPDCLIYDAEGTNLFTPPECFTPRGGGLAGKPRDVWSLGCVLFVMLFGRCPFWADAPLWLQFEIAEGNLIVPTGVVSEGAESLIRQLLQKQPENRPTAGAALQHAWL